jgi:hypothetical protein
MEFLSVDKISNYDYLAQEDAGSIAGPGEAGFGRIRP